MILYELGKVWRVTSIKNFVDETCKLKSDSPFDGEPVKLFKFGGCKWRNRGLRTESTIFPKYRTKT